MGIGKMINPNKEKEAENKAADMLINAKKQSNEINLEHETLKQQYEIYKAKIRTIIEEQLKIVDEL